MNLIRADLLAAKLHAARVGNAANFARQFASEPRLVELLWHLQDASRQPGGLDAFVGALLEHHGAHFQTAAMHQAGQPGKSGGYTLDQCLTVWKSENHDRWTDCLGDLGFPNSPTPGFPEDADPGQISYGDFLSLFVGPETTANDARGKAHLAAALRCGFERFNFRFLKSECEAAARQSLAGYLADLCTLPHVTLTPTRYCATLPAALFECLDRHALATAAEIADTVITKTVRRELEFARTEGVPVPIVGESRFGKTKAVSNWCAMYPGRARLVTTPNNNSEMAFIRAHADAFGLEYNDTTTCPALRDKVELVLRHASLLVVYDEAHALVPVGYSKSTPPRRLNWVRSAVIDQGIACAFFATPQSYHDTLDKFTKTTGYRMEQWLGRMAPPVILSKVLPEEDIIAIARTQFPELTQAQLEELADQAMASDGYLKNIEMAGRRARFLARERSHAKPSTQDVIDACTDMMPAEPRLVQEAAPIRKARPAPERKAPAPILQPSGRRPAEPVPEDAADEFPRRSTTPARLFNEPITVG